MSDNNSFIPLSVPVIAGNEWKYLKDCLDTGWVSSAGPYVTRFERELAAFCGSPFAVSTMNGTSALHLALLVAGVGKGHEVIVPTVTFIAPVNAVRYTGAEPVFMDCDEFLNIDAAKVAEFCGSECIFSHGRLVNKTTGSRVRAILPVHVFGHPADMRALMEVADKYKLVVIEDATEALGSRYVAGALAGRHAGAVGHIGVYSFNGNKIMTTGGGGMLVTADEETARRAKYLSTQAKDDGLYFIHDEVGYNYRMTNIQAALGCAQLEKLPGFIERKREIFGKYKAALEGVRGLRLVGEPEGAFSNCWLCAVEVDEDKYGISRDELIKKLRDKNVESRPLWCLNHLQAPYKSCATYRMEKAPVLSRSILNIPSSANLGDGDIARVTEVLRANAR